MKTSLEKSVQGRFKTLLVTDKKINEVLIKKFSKRKNKQKIFDIVSVNKQGNYTINTLEASPMLLQPGVSACSSNPTGGLSWGKEIVSIGNPVHVNVEFCHSVLFDSCFKDSMSWSNSKVKIEAGILGQVVAVLNDALKEAFWLACLVGSAYDKSLISSKSTLSANLVDLARRTIGSHKGILPMLREGAAKNRHWNVLGLFKDADMDGKEYKGDVVKLVRGLLDAAPEELNDDIAESPDDYVILVDSHLRKAIRKQFNNQCDNPLLNCKKSIIEKNGQLYIDNVIVSSIKELTYYDKFVGQTTKFAAITKKGNLAIGGSSVNRSEIRGNNLSLKLLESDNYQLKGDFLLVSHIKDANQIVSTIKTFKKK